MKICFATADAVPFVKGGPYIKIMETKSCLEKSGHRVELFNMWESIDRLKEFDIVHLVGSNLSTYGLARTLVYHKIPFLIEPVFFSRHSISFLKMVNSVDRIARKFIKGLWFDYGFIRDICEWSKLVLPNTTDEKHLIQHGFFIDGKKIKVIPNGVSKKFLDADPSLFINKYGIKDFILNVGHIGPKRKNILRLVRALETIGHPAVIIGRALNMGELDNVKKIISRNRHIILIEELPNDSSLLASAYAACDTFVLPSFFETPGIAALEAALTGAKIVITPYGGTKDYFKDMAVYVEPDSIESIKKGIEKALNEKRGNTLKNFVKENFLWEKITATTIHVYEESQNINCSSR